MKRSKINQYIKEMEKLAKEHGFAFVTIRNGNQKILLTEAVEC